MEGQPISVEALERPVEENRPQPNPVEGAGTGPISIKSNVISKNVSYIMAHDVIVCPQMTFQKVTYARLHQGHQQ